MNDERTPSLETILDLILYEEKEPSHEALVRWCKRYPKHAEALTRFFATWGSQSEAVGEPEIDDVRIGNLLVSHALDMLHRHRASHTASEHTGEVKRLYAEIASKKLSEEDFATACGLDESIMAKLDRRLIDSLSIPALCLKRIGEFLSMSLEAVREMLGGPPVALTAHKARIRPVTKVEDFIDAVKGSELTNNQKQEWIRVIEKEDRGQYERME